MNPQNERDDSGWDYDHWTAYALQVAEATTRFEREDSTSAHREYVFSLCRIGMRHVRWMVAQALDTRERVLIVHWALICSDWLGADFMAAQTAHYILDTGKLSVN